MVFADDERESNPTTFKFLQMAHAWAQAKKTGGAPTLSAPSGFVAASTSESKTADDDDDAHSDVASSQGDED